MGLKSKVCATEQLSIASSFEYEQSNLPAIISQTIFYQLLTVFIPLFIIL